MAINNTFNRGTFPDNAKISCVSLLDKYIDDKSSVTSFRPVNVLNIFSKIYEKIIKDFLIRKMEHHFSPSISDFF